MDNIPVRKISLQINYKTKKSSITYNCNLSNAKANSKQLINIFDLSTLFFKSLKQLKEEISTILINNKINFKYSNVSQNNKINIFFSFLDLYLRQEWIKV